MDLIITYYLALIILLLLYLNYYHNLLLGDYYYINNNKNNNKIINEIIIIIIIFFNICAYYYYYISGPIQLKLHATFLTNIIFFRWVTWTYHYRNIQFSAKCCLPLHYIITLYSMRYSHFKVGVA